MTEQASGRPGTGLATASLILGVLGLMVVWIPVMGLVSWVLCPLGLMLGMIGVARRQGRGTAIAGIVCSAVGLIGCFAWVALFGVGVTLGGVI